MPLTEERLELLLATARSNPDFARRMLQRLPQSTHDEVLARLAAPPSTRPPALPGPGLAKCRRRPAVANGLSAQLNSFARAVSRVK